MKKLLAVVFLLVAGMQLCFAQSSITVTGVVTDATDGTPMIGVTVMIQGTTTGVSTDADGKFELKSVRPGSILQFSFIGYTTKLIEVGNQSIIVVQLDREETFLDEVVVTGYGSTTKKAFTGAASSITSENISNKFDPNPIKSLQGTVPGIQMNVGSGQPGAPANIFIRGRNSINSGTQPLYVIDGIPIETTVKGIRETEGQEISPLSTLNAEDIESMTVLKDATATSIYGARAANGVILITTKRGKKGLSVNFTAKAGYEMMPYIPKTYRVLNSAKYYELSEEALLNGHKYAGSLGKLSYFDYYNEAYELGFEYNNSGAREFLGWWTGLDVSSSNTSDTNWVDAVTRNGLIQNYSLEVLGGGDSEKSAKYFLSLDYLSNDAIIKGKDMKRYSVRFNFDQQPSNRVKFGFNLNLSYSETNMGAGGGYFSDPITQALMQAPISPVYNEDGSWNFATNNGYNPVAQRSKYGDKSTAKQYRAIFSPYLQLNFTKDLYLLSRAGADIYLLDEFGYWSFLQPQGKDMRGMGENAYSANSLLTITNTLNYQKQINRHNINLLLGQEGQRTDLKETYLSGSNYAVDYMNEVINTSVPGSAQTSQSELVLSSFFSRAEYNYSNKYYLSGSFRYDGSSRFGAENRWAPFWSVGAKYRIASEEFMSNISDWMNELTIRSSYGTSGNQQVGTGWYASRDLYEFDNNYNNMPGSGRKQFGNPHLKWEQTAKFNLGLDLVLFNRINITADYYNHMTKDMVFAVPVSRTTGLESYYKNIGELSNRGFEISIGADIIKTAATTWNLTFVGSKNTNEVKRLSTDFPIEGNTTIIEKGRDIYTFKMREWAGVDPQTGLGKWYKNATGDETTTSYNSAAKRYVGKASPDFQGGILSSLSWKNLDVSMQLNYSIGGKIYGNNLRYDEHAGGSLGDNFTSYVYDNRWKQPGDIAKVPMVALMTGRSDNLHSSRFLMDATYLKIRSFSIGYTIPQNLVKQVGLSSLRMFVNADNIYTFANKDYRGFDPSGIGANGVQWWNYPLPRNIVVGFNFGF